MIFRARPLASVAVLLALSGCGGDGGGASPREYDAQGNAIVGGTVDHGHPAVAIIVQDPGYICTGTIIAERVYLTAAHCIESTNPADYVIAGVTDVFNDEPDFVIDAEAVHVHPAYDPNTNSNDIGIVEMSSDSPVAPYRYLGDNGDGVIEVGRSFTAIGYGDTGPSGGSGTKRKVDLSILDFDSTAYLYGDSNPTQGVCFGDSGGPDVVEHDGYFTVIGVHSYVTNSNCQEYGVSMRTDDSRSFIDNYAAPDAGTAKTGGGGGGGSDNPLACSVTSVGTRSPLAAALLALIAFASVIVRRPGR